MPFLLLPCTQLCIIERVGSLLEKGAEGQLEGLESLLRQQLHVTSGGAASATDAPSSSDVIQPPVDGNQSLTSPALHEPYACTFELEPELELYMETDDLEELFEADGCSLNKIKSGGGESSHMM